MASLNRIDTNIRIKSREASSWLLSKLIEDAHDGTDENESDGMKFFMSAELVRDGDGDGGFRALPVSISSKSISMSVREEGDPAVYELVSELSSVNFFSVVYSFSSSTTPTWN